MPTVRLEPSVDEVGQGGQTGLDGLGSPVLLRNVWYFIRLRWLILATFVATGLLGLLAPQLFQACGMNPPLRWPWILAGVLAIADLLYRWDALRLDVTSPRSRVEANLLVQIVVDLGVATALIHIIGSTNTYIPFILLFHIALACIFFARKMSLLITGLASLFYLVCVGLEMGGSLKAHGWLLDFEVCPQGPILSLWYAGSAVFIWFVVWYLVSGLSVDVRQRDQQLEQSNRQLLQADQDKTRRVLQTTHELKAPFAGIESNIQVLRAQHWDHLSEEARTIIDRIDRRGQRLRKRIQGILELGALRSREDEQPPAETVPIRALLESVVEELGGHAASRKVTVNLDVPDRRVSGSPKEYALLFANLVSNAISYSHEGGGVQVTGEETDGSVTVVIADRGIGISEEALQRVFEEYYRSREAARFNAMSTGLGMAIVKEIAQRYNLQVTIDSEKDQGTTVKVTLPTV